MKVKCITVKMSSKFMDGRRIDCLKTSLGTVSSFRTIKKDLIHVAVIKPMKESYSIEEKRDCWKRKVHPHTEVDGFYRRYFIGHLK